MPRLRKVAIVGISALFLMSICLTGGLQAGQKVRIAAKPKPVPELWRVAINPISPPESGIGYIEGVREFYTSDSVRTLMNYDSSWYQFYFGIYLPAHELDRVRFGNIAIAELLSGEPAATELPGGIAGFLNGGSHPDGEHYQSLILRFMIPAAEIDRIVQEGGNGYLSGGYMHLSFYNELVPNKSLYGFTTLEGFHLVKSGDSWTFEFSQGVELLEQTSEVITYYQGKKLKTEIRNVIIQEVVTEPVLFRMTWVKIS